MMALGNDPARDGAETAFLVLAVVVGLLVLGGFLVVGYTMLRSARAARRAGIDPFTTPAQLVAQALSGSGSSLEQRLAELDDLHRRGVISGDEHRAARAKALGGR